MAHSKTNRFLRSVQIIGLWLGLASLVAAMAGPSFAAGASVPPLSAKTISKAGGELQGVPVFLFIGDSNMTGMAEDQASATYTADPKVFALNASGQFAQYNPKTFTGLSNDGNTGSIGPEMEFSRLWRAANPDLPFYIVKFGAPGSAASKLNSGTITASIATNQLTVTTGSVTTGDLVYGAGISAGTYVVAGTGPYTLGQSTQQVVPFFADGDVAVNLSIASQSMSKASIYLSWSPADGKAFYLAYRRLAQAMVALSQAGKRGYLAGVIVSLGANDAGDATAAGAHNSSHQAIYRSLKASPYWNPKTVYVVERTPTSGAGGSIATVRSAQSSFRGVYRDVRLTDTDACAKNTADPIHFNLSGNICRGGADYSVYTGASAGL